ncbi:MAG: hypothetical protein HY361_04455 [Candidatus Aenigmarchaeota archaeon]|nr:hypothetical protein [Candidatus Aenigmarchaeota archaeon]
MAEKETPSETEQDDFGCFYSCKYFPEGYAKQMCEDWKAGKGVYWPDDCAIMEYEPCIKFCESEKEAGKDVLSVPSMPAERQDTPSMNGFSDFPQMPSSPADFLFHTRKPFCVENDDYRAQLVYARPSDAPDRYDEISQKQKQWISNANGIVSNEASKFGITADIKIDCRNNEINVLNVVLPKTSSQYNTNDGKTTLAIAESLKELEYKDSKVKYMVYYDGNADGCEGGKAKCSGQASPKVPDDKLSEDNRYNIGPDYSILYDGGINEIPDRYHTEIDMLAPIIMLHEYGHTLGAVQSSAPHSTKDSEDGAGHCNDEPPQAEGGNDVMCKSDKEGTIFGDACKDSALEIRYDCNNDDYFNPKPEEGSYLATHWNLGSPLNRFFEFG